VYTEAIFC